jgi:hypothetical protein
LPSAVLVEAVEGNPKPVPGVLDQQMATMEMNTTMITQPVKIQKLDTKTREVVAEANRFGCSCTYKMK